MSNPDLLYAQRPVKKNDGNNDGIIKKEEKIDKDNKIINAIFSPPDSLEISVYHAHNPERFYPYPDSMLDHYFQQSDPVREQLLDYTYLGSLGNPARPTLFEVEERKGLNIGFRQFDLYDRPLDSIRYFKVNRTFTDTYYAQGGTKDDFIFKGTFTRNLSSQWNLSLDYTRISHIGFYSRQKSRHTAFNTNAAYRHKKNRYKAFISYSFNDIQQQDNGGVTTDTLFDDDFYSDRTNIPISLSNANTRTKEHILSYTHYYDFLAPKTDSLGKESGRHLTLGHQFAYTPGNYKFTDKELAEDSIYYQYLQVDNRGLRHYLNWDKIENTFKVSTFKTEGNRNKPRDLFNVGITHIYQKTHQEPKDTFYNALYLFGGWDYNPIQAVDINIYTHYGIGNAGNEYLIKGKLNFNLNKLGQLNAEVSNQRFSPDLLQGRMFISKREIFNNNFKKPITTSIKAFYHLPVSKTTLRVQYHLLNNYIYYDTLGFARQADKGVNVLQLILQQDFRFKKIGMENTIAFQNTNDEFIRVPKVFMKNSLFVEGKIFKKVMLARLGLDFRMNTSYFADNYQAVLGQFHLQNEEKIKTYPALDLFLSFKVQTFRAFAKMENITDWFTKKRYYQVPGHPMPDAHFRFGVSWRFID